jgi:hypothetical protein
VNDTNANIWNPKFSFQLIDLKRERETKRAVALEGGLDIAEEAWRRRRRRRILWLQGVWTDQNPLRNRSDRKVSLPVHGRISTTFLLGYRKNNNMRYKWREGVQIRGSNSMVPHGHEGFVNQVATDSRRWLSRWHSRHSLMRVSERESVKFWTAYWRSSWFLLFASIWPFLGLHL